MNTPLSLWQVCVTYQHPSRNYTINQNENVLAPDVLTAIQLVQAKIPDAKIYNVNHRGQVTIYPPNLNPESDQHEQQ